MMNENSETVYKSVFITTNYKLDTGSGNVSHHQTKALSAVTNVEKILTELDINSKLPPLPDTPRSFLWDYLTANEVKDCRVDLAFFNGSPFGVTMNCLKTAKTIVDIPAHNIELSVEEFEKRNGIGSYPFYHMTNEYLWNIYSQHIQRADVVLCPSKLSADYISSKLKLKNRLAIIPHGCYLPDKSLLHYPNSFSVAHVGANSTDGQFYLVQAWQQIKRSRENPIRLSMVGRGTNMWYPFGVFSSEYADNIGTVYNDCSVYVQPSVTEGFGIPVLEAMAYGKPVIVTQGAGSHELVEDGNDGFVVPIRDSASIKQKIEYFYDNPDEIKRMGSNARQKAKNYSWETIEKGYQKLIANTLHS